MSTQTCNSCLYGRIDSIGQIFCAKYSTNFPVTHSCNQWDKKSDDIHNEHSNPGYVYVLSNPDLPGLIKVGMTYKNPKLRAKELSSTTGVSSKYEIEYYGKVADRVLAEKAAHNRLKNFHHRKEFFKVNVEVAIYCVETISSPIERAYIKPGNERKVFEYAKSRDQIPYKQIEKEWRARQKKNRDYKTQVDKTRNWEEMVENYMKKRTGKDESLFNYNKMPGNPNINNAGTNSIKEEYDPNKVVLLSELEKAEQKSKTAQEELEKNKREMDRLKNELSEEKNKGLFKRLFS